MHQWNFLNKLINRWKLSVHIDVHWVDTLYLISNGKLCEKKNGCNDLQRKQNCNCHMQSDEATNLTWILRPHPYSLMSLWLTSQIDANLYNQFKSHEIRIWRPLTSQWLIHCSHSRKKNLSIDRNQIQRIVGNKYIFLFFQFISISKTERR